jgi:FAD/FMN-containing dehydrogenase/Fe-S oxidoreductase
VLRLLGARAWELLNLLREERRTGRSARMLYEVLGDIWVVQRNPYLEDDLLTSAKRRGLLIDALQSPPGRGRTPPQPRRRRARRLRGRTAGRRTPRCRPLRALRRRGRAAQRTRRLLGRVTARDNIKFDGLSRVSHVTDATDWRVEYPFVVLTPDTEAEMAALVKGCIELGLTIIPRGGGTGYTGGAVPLTWRSAVINTEKLEAMTEVEWVRCPASTSPCPPSIRSRRRHPARGRCRRARRPCLCGRPHLGRGQLRGRQHRHERRRQEGRAVGHRARQPGQLAHGHAQAQWLEVTRLNHNLGKIHDVETGQLRAQDLRRHGQEAAGHRTLDIPGRVFRKEGLGKDVTDKFLAGLPGVQKEGCDGLITSARWIVHRMPAARAHGVPGILRQRQGGGAQHRRDQGPDVQPARWRHPGRPGAPGRPLPEGGGLRHQEQARAVGQRPAQDGAHRRHRRRRRGRGGARRQRGGAHRQRPPWRRLRRRVGRRAQEVLGRPQAHRGHRAPHQRLQGERGRGDPAARMGEYTEGIERINVELSLRNKLQLADRLVDFLPPVRCRWARATTSGEAPGAELLEDRVQQALVLLREVRALWQFWLQQLDVVQADAGRTLFEQLQDYSLRASWKVQLLKPLQLLFSGAAFAPIVERCKAIHAEVLRGRVWVALHMHAGDGNVHTNIPVNSDNYEMLQTAHEAVARIMALARSLDGVISGEHGIGITKLEFLTDDELAPFADYKQRVDPEGRFNKGKLLKGTTGEAWAADLSAAYTPSFGLMGHESLIMQQSDIGAISDSVKDCLRCGKCKPVCATHVPRANLLYSPRNKILATSLLIEAFLYEEQTRRGVSLAHWADFEDVADHCTVCHKCANPCPVKIDFGDVTMNMRNLLRKMGKKSFRPGNAAAMAMLNATNPQTIKLMRSAMVGVGIKAQRLAHDVFKLAARKQTAQPPATLGTAPLKEQVIHFVNKKMPGGLPTKTARALLDIEDRAYVPIIRDPARTTAETEAVFYFPGCGSERLFSQVGLATQAMLWQAGVQTVLPPGYLCCGYPQRGGGQFDKAEKIITDNRVLFHRVANTLNYLDIKTVVVSCGTCYDQLQGYKFEDIFPGCRIVDIHEYLLEKGITLPAGRAGYLYHDPCHSPMKQQDPMKTVKALVGPQVVKSERCCGESGTLA